MSEKQENIKSNIPKPPIQPPAKNFEQKLPSTKVKQSGDSSLKPGGILKNVVEKDISSFAQKPSTTNIKENLKMSDDMKNTQTSSDSMKKDETSSMETSQNETETKTVQKVFKPKLKSMQFDEDDAFSPVVSDKIKKCYVLGKIKNSKSSLVISDEKEIMILKVTNKQQVVPTDFCTLLNVRNDITRDASAMKIIKAEAIYMGKTFYIDHEETKARITTFNIKLEGVGQEAEELDSTSIVNKEPGSIVEKLSLKVIWVGSKIFENTRSVKGLTENGVPILISLNSPHHFAIQENKVYTFLRIQKTENWFSKSQILSDIHAKFKTIAKTTIKLVELPSNAFLELGKDIGRVVLLDQQITLFDQCPQCWKTRMSQTCHQSTCGLQGIKKEKNQKFLARFAVMNEEQNLEAFKVWSDQLLDYKQPVPDDELASVIVAEELEEHFKDKLICYKIKTDYNSDQQENKFLTEVTVKKNE